MLRHMIDQRRIILDPPRAGRGIARDVGKIGVLLAVGVLLLGGETQLFRQPTLEQSIGLDSQIYSGMPSLQWRDARQFRHALAIGQRDILGDAPRGLVAIAGGQRRHREAGGEPLQIDREIDAGQRLVEVVDVEQRIAFRREKGAEVHQMAVAARLELDAGNRLAREIHRHQRRGAAQEREGRLRHALAADRQQRRQTALVRLVENGDRDRGPPRRNPRGSRAKRSRAISCPPEIAPRRGAYARPRPRRLFALSTISPAVRGAAPRPKTIITEK